MANIANLSEEWQGHSGAEVQAFLKTQLASRYGYLHIPTTKEQDGYYHIYCFASHDDYTTWSSNRETYASLLLQDVTIPISTDIGKTYAARLYAQETPTDAIISVTKSKIIHLRFCGVETENSVSTNSGIQGTITFQRSTNGGETWTTVGTTRLSSRDTSSTTYDEVDIGQYFGVTNPQQIRMRASYVVYDDNDDIIASPVSAWITFTDITYTTLTITPNYDITQPVAASAQGIPLNFYLTGEVARKLHVKIGSYEQYFVIGANEYTNRQNPWTGNMTDDGNHSSIFNHGVRTVEAWLTCSDGSTADALSSEHVFTQVMVDAGTDDTPQVILTNLKTSVVNYVPSDLCQWAVWVPEGANVESVPVTLMVTNQDGSEEYLDEQFNAVPETLYSQTVTVEIENSVNDTLSAKFKVFVDGTQQQAIDLSVDNTEKYAPTSADWVLNPKVRNNTTAAVNDTIDGASATFSGFSFTSDGWIEKEDETDTFVNDERVKVKQKVLRVMAGESVTIQKDWLGAFASNRNANVTLEIDMMVRNVVDETQPIITASETQGSGWKGLQLLPLEGAVMTSSKVARAYQDFRWQEDKRVHISINILSAMAASNDPNANTMAICRVFVNGVINREFLFNAQNGEWRTNGSNIVIGHPSADIDIYSIRLYNAALSNTQILKNYIATIPVAEEKIKFRDQNNILNANGLVDYDLCKNKKINVLVWHGIQPTHADSAKKTGWWEIHVYNADGTEDLEHSGTICQGSKTLVVSRQGTTANTYYYSNLQTKLKDVTATITVDADKIHTDAGVEIPSGATTVTVTDGWIDGNGMYRGAQYKSANGVPYATKLVGKINYASSMQSHLMGACRMYNDLHQAIVGTSGRLSGRVAKYEELFLFFTQGDNDVSPVYQGGITWGAGKMDDTTWGYKKSKTEHATFCMIEGADNNKPLTDFRIPWDSSKIFVDVDDGEVAGWKYKESGNEETEIVAVNFDLDRCKTENRSFLVSAGTYETLAGPSATVENNIKALVNFIYKHNVRIKVYSGPYQGVAADSPFLLSSHATNDRDWQWWCTTGDDAYKLKRFDYYSGQWVNAGWNETNEQIEELVLTTKYSSVDTTGDPDVVNARFIAAIAADAKTNIGSIIDVESLKFHYAFLQQFLAGTDNCSKNTYYTFDPILGKWVFSQDDMDTILATDNSGFQSKPYYIDRQRPTAEGGTDKLYEGSANALFNLCEAMYENDSSIRNMMKQVFSAMSSLVSATDDLPLKNSEKMTPWGAMWKYFFTTQKRIPAVAYNEQARIRYEYPQSQNFVSDRGVIPISQSMGDQLQSELQFVKRRLVMFASYAEWGEFSPSSSGNIGLADASVNFGIQAYTNIDGTAAGINFVGLVTHQYLWPGGRIGQTNNALRERCTPGVPFNFTLASSVQGDTACALYGSHFYRSLGNLGDINVITGREAVLQARRLTTLTIVPTDYTKPNYRPSSISVNAPLLETVDIHNSSLIGGSLDLSNCPRLQSVNSTGCPLITEVNLPQTNRLTTVHLGTGITTLSISGVPNLTTLDFELKNISGSMQEAVDSITSLSVDCSSWNQTRAKELVTKVLNLATLATLNVTGISWDNVNVSVVDAMASVPNGVVTGTIQIADESGGNNGVKFVHKVKFLERWGAVDSSSNPIYLQYTKNTLQSLTLDGRVYVMLDSKNVNANNKYTFTKAPDNEYRNNFTGFTWSIQGGVNSYATIDSTTGEITVNPTAVAAASEGTSITIVCTAALIGGGTATGTFTVYVYNRLPKLGDYVYADASACDVLYSDKTVMGLCAYINPNPADPTKPERVLIDPRSYMNLKWGQQTEPSNSTTIYGESIQWIRGIYQPQANGDSFFNGWNEAYMLGSETDEHDSEGFKVQTDSTKMDFNDNATGHWGFVTVTQEMLNRLGEVNLAVDAKRTKRYLPENIVVGSRVPRSYLNTLYIIRIRDIYLQNIPVNSSVTGLPVPDARDANGVGKSEYADPSTFVEATSETNDLSSKISSAVASYGSSYDAVYFPHASYVYAYRPNVLPGETLAPCFDAHQWMLPSMGLLKRFMYYKYYRTSTVLGIAINRMYSTAQSVSSSNQSRPSNGGGMANVPYVSSAKGIGGFIKANYNNFYNLRMARF
ncbi:MAG: hypothetical protein J5510_05450 [Prevotella sp.]|nr:hypothetical protein [Prevotella sp.]